MSKQKNRLWLSLIFFLFAGLGVWGSGCGGPDLDSFSTLQQFSTCDELLGYIQDRAKQEIRERYSSSGNFGSRGSINFFPGSTTASDSSVGARENGSANTKQSSGTPSGMSGGKEYSKTNNQVGGVDEADIIKNDGKYLYILNRNYFLIVKAWPANEMKIVGQYKMDSRPREMFVHADRVVLFSTVATSSKNASANKALFEGASVSRNVYKQLTKITILNIQDKSHPGLWREVLAEGEYKTSRRIGKTVRIVLYSRLDGPAVNIGYAGGSTPWEQERKQDEMIEKGLKSIDSTKLSDWLPVLRDVRYKGGKELSRKVQALKNCNGFYRPSVHSGRGIISVFSLQMDKPEETMQHASLVSRYGHTYASEKALYIATQPSSRNNVSHFHKFDIQQGTKPAVYLASGSVSGGILNQFAMDEYDGHFRVATTSREGFGTENNIFVLKQNKGRLDIVGSVKGLARGERIYSARFMKDRGYIVTFRQVDPLFTIDLSKPTAPRLAGELKIPGFSTYIHPLDRDHLLTIGADGTSRGSNGNIQLAIFDVSDFSKPKQAHKHVIDANRFGGGTSAALYDHKAFNYFAAKKMLAIPVSTRSYNKSGESFVGVQLFNIDTKKGITLHGKVSHSSLYKQLLGKPGSGIGSYQVEMRRSAFIEDFFYSISTAGMKVHKLDSLSKEVTSVFFPK